MLVHCNNNVTKELHQYQRIRHQFMHFVVVLWLSISPFMGSKPRIIFMENKVTAELSEQ